MLPNLAPISRLVWKLLSFVNTARNLKIPFMTEKPKVSINMKKVMRPSSMLEVRLLICLVLTS